MQKRQLWCVTGLLAALLVVVTATAQAPPRARGPITLPKIIAAETKVEEEDVEKVLKALGPAVRDILASGNVLELPNLGRFRVVRIPEHRDMVNGRPTMIPSSNYVEFLPAGDIVGAANSPNARPAETVPAFEYNPIPGQTPGFKMPNQRISATRTR